MPDRFEAKPTAESHFSWLRTRMSLERTLMSWVRTATALIGFGFTIVQFFERLHDMEGVAPALRPQMPRYLGLGLILAGDLALVVAIWHYEQMIRYLWGHEFAAVAGVPLKPKRTPLLAVAIVLFLIGVFAFISVFTRML
jgi:inner membrane protein YidH